MTTFLDWLPEVLRNAGVDTYVMPGAERRTSRSDGLAVRGVVWHHTATGPNWQDGHVAALLRDGRKDLAGPLAQVGIERDGTWVLVALGRANHNGYGHWGNDSLGLEFYNSGVGEPWPAAQVRSGVIGTAAVLTYLGRHISDVLGHRETDPRRKIDPAGLDMTTVRRQIDAAMRNKATPPPVKPKETDVQPNVLVVLTYNACLGRNPSMQEIAAGVDAIDAIGQLAYVESIANSDEAKAHRAA